MFRYYRQAVVCYVYLSDVEGRDNDALQRSWWFTRGWTLQELLAPGSLIFYDFAWDQIGRLTPRPLRPAEHEFNTVVSEVSGIPAEILKQGELLQYVSVAQKMSWAADRETTRPEDKAYCMLGIVDVNMPLLYEEGGDKAFKRLLEETMKSSADHTLFAWGQTDSTRSATIGQSSVYIEAPGLLAKGMKDFAGCRNVAVNVPRGRKVSHYFLTNIGVHITLPWRALPGTQPEVGLAALNCANYTQATHGKCPALPLLSSTAKDERYHRPGRTPHIMVSQDFFHSAEVKSFYLSPARL